MSLIGQTLNHFKVIDRLGKGGMGEVYLAEDAKLKRKVALKVLPEEVAADPSRLGLFQREAETIAALSHPNIVTIYSIEEDKGLHFLTMELVDGETLTGLIPPEGMEVESFLRFSTPVTEALLAAHERGIIHRDLKPGNIMVSRDGRIKVLDFGLAKLIHDDSDPNLSQMETREQTEHGVVLGTMPYMSPEQVQGKKLDRRSDIFSLGVVFYEMITGHRPFRGDTSAELISCILRDVPEPASTRQASIPGALERILRRCLMKDPRDRYQTARGLCNDLRDLASGDHLSARPGVALPTQRSSEMWIAVLPFKSPKDEESEALSDGLVQDITAALSQFSYLSVIARDSTHRFKGESFDLRRVSEEIGARYALQGGIRRSGSLIRVNVQLIDAPTGANLWAETYNRNLEDSDIFTVQDEITDRVAATVADNFGVLVRSMIASLEDKPDEELTANDYVLRWFGYEGKRLNPQEHARIKATLEQAAARFPLNAEVWGCLSFVHFHECAFGFNQASDSFERVLKTAQRAVELNRASQIAHEALAWAHFVRRDVGAVPSAVKRAVSLNPRNSHVLAVAGLILVHTREFERGAAIAQRAIELNPHHAGWFHFPLIWDHYSRGEYEQVLERAKRVNMPGFFWTPLVIASVCGELGRKKEAAAAVAELLTIDPEFAAHARQYVEPWNYATGFIEPLLAGLRKAGLEVPESLEVEAATESPRSAGADQIEREASIGSKERLLPTGAEAGLAGATVPWIAVLPLKHPGNDRDIESFAEGLTEDVTSGLSRFSYLHVVSRSSAARYQDQSPDVRKIGQELGARYIVEGGVRKAGGKVRVNLQVIDSLTGTHLWAETYDRDLESGGIFSVQDEITDHVVATVADPFGVVARSMSAPTALRSADSLTPYEAVLRSFIYRQRLSAEDHLIARSALQYAVETQPDHADAWACLALMILDEHKHQFNEMPGTLDRALEAARRAVDLNPAGQLGNFALAETYYYRKDLGAFRAAADRAISINRRDGNTLAMMGILLAYAGDWKRGVALTESAMSLNPHHPGWYRFGGFFNSYRKGEYRDALAIAQRINLPGYFPSHYVLAIAHAQIGNLEATGAPARELLRLYPDFETVGRKEHLEKWFFQQPALIEQIIDGLQKAGLNMRPSADGLKIAPAVSVVEPRVPLIGRDQERADLDQKLDSLSQGKGGLVLLGGEPGVGKTRLATEILMDAQERGMLALTGHAYEEEGAPFITAAEILEEMLRLVPRDRLRAMLGDNAPEMARLLPDLRTQFPDIPEPVDLPLERQRRHLFKNVLEFLQRASRESPLVLLLDDLHWADESSLLLLEYLAPHAADLPLLMLGTYRDVELDVGKPFEKTLARLVRQNLAVRLSIKRLGEPDVADLLAALGEANPSPSLVSAIFHETEGNPFFVTEVFEHLSEEGLLFEKDGSWKADLDVRALDVPEGVRLVIGRRLERLSSTTPAVLRAAAVIGRDFDVRLLEGLDEWTADTILDSIDEAEKARLVAPVSRVREARYSFTHELIRHTLLGSLSLPRRQRLHLRIAGAMERVYAPRLADHAPDLAFHLYQAGASADLEKTVHYLTLAGDRSLAAAAPDKAIRYFDEALSVLEDFDQKGRALLLFQRGEAKRALSRWNEAAADWNEALPVLESEGKTDLVTRICWELAYQLTWRNRRREATALIQRGLARAGEKASAGRCRLLAILGHIRFLDAEFDTGEKLLDQALAMAEMLGEEKVLGGEVLLGHIYLYEHTLKPLKMAETGKRALELARRSGRPWDVSSALGISLLAWGFLGEFDRARAGADEVEPLARQEGDLGTIGHALLFRGLDNTARGDLDAARANYREIIRLWREAEFPWLSAVQAMLGQLEAWQGNTAEGRKELAAAVDAALAGSFCGFEEAHLLLAEAYEGDPEAAARLDRLASQLPRPGFTNGLGSWSVLLASIESAVLLERQEQAAVLYPLVLQTIADGTVVLFGQGLVEKAAGIAAAAGGSWEDAEGHFENALRLADELPHRVEQPEVRRWYAWMLVSRDLPGDRKKATALLAEAVPMYRTLNLPRHLELAEALLHETAL